MSALKVLEINVASWLEHGACGDCAHSCVRKPIRNERNRYPAFDSAEMLGSLANCTYASVRSFYLTAKLGFVIIFTGCWGCGREHGYPDQISLAKSDATVN
jgi:hypothetical protein